MNQARRGHPKRHLFFTLTLFIGLTLSPLSYSQWIKFGNGGKAGLKGQQGLHGTNGRNVVVEANGENLSLRLRGGDGAPGRDGQNGEDASNCWQRRGEWNMVGAEGGKGGDGGMGGRGGHGGHTTIYYQNTDQLASIMVDAEGGRGSYGGRGGEGGRPCFCTYRYWRVRYKDRNGRIFFRDFQCLEGERGKRGKQGHNSPDGLLGRVKLVKSDRRLQKERKVLRVGAEHLDQPLNLSQNIWEQRSGILNLLHPSSLVSNEYDSFVKRITKTITFHWKADRSPEEVLQGKSIKTTLNNHISYHFPKDYWVDSFEQISGRNHKSVTINHMVSFTELSKITPLKMELQGEGTTLTLRDLEGLDSFIKTEFFLETNWRLIDNYWEYYRGKIPEDLVEFDGDRIHLKVGKLPVREKSFKKRSSLTLRIVRSFKTDKLKLRPISLKKSKGRPLEVSKGRSL